MQESEAVHKLGLLKAKAALVKGKIVAAKAPHIIAHVAVAKEVKAKSKLAIVKTIEAVSVNFHGEPKEAVADSTCTID